MMWFTSVRADGQPECVPVWFMWRDDDTILIYSQPTAQKLRKIQVNSKVAMALDVSDLGRDNIRMNGVAAVSEGELSAANNEAYLAKYLERICALFESPERFSGIFSVALIVTPHRILSPSPGRGVAYAE